MKRKQNRLKLTIILILLIACISTVYGQVTIGSNLEPVKGALLDLKEKDDSSGGITSEKGLNLPRVSLTSLTDITNGDITGIDANNKNAHIGLTVYNVREDTPNGFFKCVYVWEGTKWVSLCDGSACPLVLKSTANSNSNDKYTDIVGYTANASTTAYAIKGECCTKSGDYKYEILSGTGLTSSVTDVGVSPSNSTGELIVTFKTENPDTKPRIALIKVTDPCDNTAYFTAVQQGKPAATASTTCYLTFSGTSPDGSGYADKPYWIAKASGDVMSGNNPNNTVTAISSCCPTFKTISITGENFDNNGSTHLDFASKNLNQGTFRLQWKTANKSTTPRVAVVKIVDNCDNVGYFTVIQGGNGALTFSGTSPDGSDYADKPYWVASASGDVMSGNNPDNTVTAISSSCPASQSTPFTISITGENFDNSGNHLVFSNNTTSTITNNGQFRLKWNTANTGTAPRVAVVKVVDNCGSTGYFTVIQKGKDSGFLSFSGTAPVPEENDYADKPYWIASASGNNLLPNPNTVTVKSDKCPGNPIKTAEVTGGNFDNNGSSNSEVEVTNISKSNGTFCIRWKTANQSTTPRVAVVKVVDNCDNVGYFTTVQKGKDSTTGFLSFSGTAPSPEANDYADKPYWIAKASGDVMSGNNPDNTVTVKSDKCPGNPIKTAEVIGGNFDNNGSSNSEVEVTNINKSNGTFRIRWKTANPGTAPRVAVVKVVDDCDNVGYFTTVQKGKPCSMTFTSGGPYAIIESTARIATTGVSSTCCTIDGTPTNLPVSCIPTGSYATAKTENGTLTVTFANDNTGTEDRTALVTITDDCGNTGYFTVVQKGKAAASTACQLELKSIQADRSSADKYTDIVEYTANASTTAYAVKGDCCPTNGYTYEVIWGDGVLTNPTSGNNTTGRFTVTYNTENTDPAPRVTVIKVKDACGNYAYFTAVQKGKASTACPLELKDKASDGQDKYTETVKATAGGQTKATFAIKGPCCTENGNITYEKISGEGRYDYTGTNQRSFTVTYDTENPSTAPRVTVIKVKDPCGNFAYFIAVQEGKACALVLKSTPDRSSADKYTDIVEYTANASTTVNAIEGGCCPTSRYTYEVISGAGVLTNPTSGNNTTGIFTVTYKTENTDPAPRVTVIKVKDACDNYAYFTAVQKAKPACQLELKSIQADRSSADKYTDIVEYTANASTTAYAVKGDCCPTNGYTYEVIWGDGELTNPTSGNNTTGIFTVTYKTENTDPAPRVTVIKVKDACGNYAYFTAVQKGKASTACPLELKSAASNGQDKYTETVKATAGGQTKATFAIKGPCCTDNRDITYEKISGEGVLNTTGTNLRNFTVTYDTENPSTAPRVTVIKVKDPCGNFAYFIAVQEGKACALELKSIQADRSSADKYTDIVENTANASTTAYAIKGDCCPTNGYTYEVISGAGELTNPTSGNNTTGIFTVTYKTENTDPAPRVTVIKVKDACGNYAYFTAVQKGKAATSSLTDVGQFIPGRGTWSNVLPSSLVSDVSNLTMPSGTYRVYICWTGSSGSVAPTRITIGSTSYDFVPQSTQRASWWEQTNSQFTFYTPTAPGLEPIIADATAISIINFKYQLGGTATPVTFVGYGLFYTPNTFRNDATMTTNKSGSKTIIVGFVRVSADDVRPH